MLDNNKSIITDTRNSPHARLTPVPIADVMLGEGFWFHRIQINRAVTIPSQYKLLESTGRLDNFRRVFGEIKKPYQGYIFNDSDVYKWLEAASWSMVNFTDEKIKRAVDLVISLIVKAQDKDGYLNTYFSFERTNERWMNLHEKHELYCAGHLIQAAIAHHRVTGEDRLLNVAIRLADHLLSKFGPKGIQGTSGHPEIEMAVIELYRETGNDKYLELATLFINRRGRHLLGGAEYIQDHIPLRQMELLAGHAVRALYLCSGAADLVLETGEQVLLTALERLWANMVRKQMYISGGVGARYEGEAFGRAYELPNTRAYAETCASIANIMWNWRMLQIQGNARYADLLEWTLYNAAMPGISLDGKKYFYINPLKDDGESRRQEWFDCACCPPNISRTIAMFPGYMYGVSEEGIWLHNYAQSKVRIKFIEGRDVELEQRTMYPWDGKISVEIISLFSDPSIDRKTTAPEKFSLFFRLPGWLNNPKIDVKVNDDTYKHNSGQGSYLEIHRDWIVGDKISIDLPMDVCFSESHPLVEENIGRIAITRGPLLYCMEEVDNPNLNLYTVRINPSIRPDAEYIPDLIGGIVRIRSLGHIRAPDIGWNDKLYRPLQLENKQQNEPEIELSSVPYFAWANRKQGAMSIWHSAD